MGALDNADYSGKSSLTSTEGKYYTSMVLFQDASEIPLAKFPVSSPNTCRRCHLLHNYHVSASGKPPVGPCLPPDMLLSPENFIAEHPHTDSA